MLQYQTVSPALLGLLKNLTKEEAFSSFLLVGGTALALQIGHRKSIDLDFFGKAVLDEIEITEILNKYNPSVHIIQKSKNILVYAVDDMKVDVVNYPYEWLAKPKVENKIQLASIEDIAAMKLNAISGRGSKKDFVDIYFLMKKFSLKEMLNLYNRKYPEGSEFLVIKSLSYFEDAEKQQMPEMLIPTDWEQIKSDILKQVNKLL